ncbi:MULTISPECIES: hypothetical protein [Methylococcus]|uniref:Uncharacterized protein n=1 Tax=Methylococcus capsulatus TaxID=414 RepID=A0ABZ2F6E1_METCP|nr:MULTISPECIES: hypothetical protein [Methylococcus]MDF9393007.1 hypothetical protein [Methylococcus capsulatus]
MKPLRPTHPSATVSVGSTPAVMAHLAAKQGSTSLAPVKPVKAPPAVPQPVQKPVDLQALLRGLHELRCELREFQGRPMSEHEKAMHRAKLGVTPLPGEPVVIHVPR